MKNRIQQFKSEGLVAVVLFAVFSLCVLMVLFSGVDIYKGIIKRDTHTHYKRTAVQYITTKVRQADKDAAITTSDFNGKDALIIKEIIDEKNYITRIYCHDGWLMELVSEEDVVLSLSDGEKITEAEHFEVKKEESAIKATVVVNGETSDVELYLRSEAGEIL